MKLWRESDHVGASDTTRELLHYWFDEEHILQAKDGDQHPFRYYFCQREALETFIYLYEIRGLRTLSGITSEFIGSDAYNAAFLAEMLFGKKVSLFDQRLINRLGNQDVRERIRAVFVPLILSKSTIKLEQRALGLSKSVVQWKPYQANHSVKHPAIEAPNTAFNLIPCSNAFEVDMAQFLNRAPDVSAFCKNAGPEAISVEYLMKMVQRDNLNHFKWIEEHDAMQAKVRKAFQRKH